MPKGTRSASKDSCHCQPQEQRGHPECVLGRQIQQGQRVLILSKEPGCLKGEGGKCRERPHETGEYDDAAIAIPPPLLDGHGEEGPEEEAARHVDSEGVPWEWPRGDPLDQDATAVAGKCA